MLFWVFIWDVAKKFIPALLVMAFVVFALLSLAFCGRAFSADLALGDSIALGTGHALRIPTVARVGAGSCTIADWVPKHGRYNRVVLSAGINDQGLCVYPLRNSIVAREVIWILPAPINGGRTMVLQSMRAGDKSVSYACKGGCTKKNFHPASYAVVARAVRSVW